MARVVAIGVSHRTWQPRAAAAAVSRWWASGGTTTATTSGRTASIRARG
jgi:hypothetical protein